jgi:putative addiction module component (TIGR02574 family)
MSKTEILAELPKLAAAERREIFDSICEMEERDLLNGGATPEEKALLDRELEEYRRNPHTGATWDEVVARIRKPSHS